MALRIEFFEAVKDNLRWMEDGRPHFWIHFRVGIYHEFSISVSGWLAELLFQDYYEWVV